MNQQPHYRQMLVPSQHLEKYCMMNAFRNALFDLPLNEDVLTAMYITIGEEVEDFKEFVCELNGPGGEDACYRTSLMSVVVERKAVALSLPRTFRGVDDCNAG